MVVWLRRGRVGCAEVALCVVEAVEAVLCALDPRDAEERRQLSSGATAAVAELVRRLPMVSFHKVRQRSRRSCVAVR